MKEKSVCPHCARQMNVHNFALNRSLAGALLKIAKQIPPGFGFNFKDLRDKEVISSSDYTNMSHLKYLGLIEKISGVKRLWQITDKGHALLIGQPIAKSVKVFNNKVIEVSQETMRLSDAIGFYEPPDVWARRAESLRKKEMQLELI